MTSNGLPPARRKPGSVGLPAGPEVTILDDKGTILPVGEKGEIAVRGANIHDGYLNNPAANAATFTDGWFRTGDQGLIDGDGDLKITGRLKEIINRGGEKISPLEVDNVLLDHPLVAQAVTFAVPHAMLGEEVGAAVVLTAITGGMIALQAPINSTLGKRIGTLPAASVSFALGTIVLVLLALVFGGGFGKLGEARHLGWIYLMGGILGAAYVTTVLVTVRTLGAGGVTAATIAGQLTLAVVVDQLGILHVAQKPITLARIVGVALLAAGVFLIVRN
jgi:uncharacterized membrane protein YdcZ (DUF606 family)